MDSLREAILRTPPVTLALVAVVSAFFVLAPTLVAALRRHKDLVVIATLNVAFFYAFEVWVPLLVWSFTGDEKTGLVDRLRGRKGGAVFGAVLLAAVGLGGAYAAVVWLPKLASLLPSR